MFNQDLLSNREHPVKSPSIPFINTPFSRDLMVFLLLWPMWWVLGIEQFLAPFFLAWELVRYLVQNRGRFSVKATICLAGLFALWCLPPVVWVKRTDLDVFLKDVATAWSQVLMLLLLWNAFRKEEDWWQAVLGLNVLAAYVALGGLVFALGIWRGTIFSAVARILPVPLIKSSAFLISISVRRFGEIVRTGHDLPIRISSFALKPTGLSQFALVLIPLIVWRFYQSKGWVRYAQGAVLAGLLVCLFGTGSRTAYLAFVVGSGLLVMLRLDLLRRRRRLFLLLALVVAAAALAALVQYVGPQQVKRALRGVLMAWRPGSLAARIRIYKETLRLIPRHPIVGWGVPIEIEGVRSQFSAGTHSGYLSMLFQHGVVGLALYLGLWFCIWRDIVRGLRQRAAPRLVFLFWITCAVAMLALNIREAADGWGWDQLVTMAVWTMWGLIITAPRFDLSRASQSGGALMSSSRSEGESGP